MIKYININLNNSKKNKINKIKQDFLNEIDISYDNILIINSREGDCKIHGEKEMQNIYPLKSFVTGYTYVHYEGDCPFFN